MSRRGRSRGLFGVATAEELLDRDLEARNDARVAAFRDQLGVGIAGRNPCISVFGVGDDVGEAPGADREDPSGFFVGVAERVESCTSLGAEDEIARSQLLFAVLVPEEGTTAEDEEHLLGAEVHMYRRLRRAACQFVQRSSHPGVLRPPEDSISSPVFFVLSVPCVGEEVLTIHSWYLRVVAVGAQCSSARSQPSATLRRKRGCSPRETATSPPDPQQDHACSRVLMTARPEGWA